jgi:hypothetical protein
VPVRTECMWLVLKLTSAYRCVSTVAWIRTQRFQGFVALLLAAASLMALAIFVFLPMMLFAPSKFALSFTLGSLMFLGAFMLLRGPKTVGRQLMAPDRLVFTSAYVASVGTWCNCVCHCRTSP